MVTVFFGGYEVSFAQPIALPRGVMCLYLLPTVFAIR